METTRTNIEEALDHGLQLLKKGASKEEVFLLYPHLRSQLEPSLAIAEHLLSLPKNPVPRPALQRKFMKMPLKTTVWFTWLHISRFAGVSMAAVLLIAAVTGTTYATSKSLPGQTLFPLKKQAEQFQLRFAGSEVEKANMHMNITKKRLADAQTIFNKPQKNESQELAALSELSKETQVTLQAVKSAAAANAISEKNHPIVASLEDITERQQVLLNKIKSETDLAAANEPNANQQVKAIKQLIEIVAATNEQATLITLSPDPGSVVVSGSVTGISKYTITVEQTAFDITEKTVFTDKDGRKLDLVPEKNAKVTVKGSKDKLGSLKALEVALAENLPAQNTEAAASTTTPAVKPAATSSIGSATTTSKKQPVEFNEPTDTAPSQAIGTFILEDPSPQFK